MTEKPAEHLADSIEHDEEMPTQPRSTFTPDHETEVESGEPFQWDYDVITNLMALFTCFFASTWMLVVPSGTIGFISEAFPLESSKSIWIAAAVTIPNCVLQSFIGDISDHLGRKGLLLGGMLLGIAGTLITSRAKTMNMVIGGQVLS
jgi:predicted MFS family arabinose efflux permease